MGISRDNSDLPASSGGGGFPPDSTLRYVAALADAWQVIHIAGRKNELAYAESRRYEASSAGGCARSLAYKVAEKDARIALAAILLEAGFTRDEHGAVFEPAELTDEQQVKIALARERVEAWAPTNPPGVADSYRMGLGTMVHEGLEPAIADAFDGMALEQKIDLRPEIDGTAIADVVHVQKDRISERTGKPWVTVVSIKTMNGFGFKMAATTDKGPPEGPRHGARLQVALEALKLDADEIVIGVLSLEAISVGQAAKYNWDDDRRRFAAEWTYQRDEFEPWAVRELRRANKVLEMLDAGELAPRAIDDPEIPAAARIVNPVHNAGYGQWVVEQDGDIVQTGTTWWCGYCWQRDRCVADGGPGAVPVTIGGRA